MVTAERRGGRLVPPMLVLLDAAANPPVFAMKSGAAARVIADAIQVGGLPQRLTLVDDPTPCVRAAKRVRLCADSHADRVVPMSITRSLGSRGRRNTC